MPDSFTEFSSQSIFGRLGDSIKGVLFGLILIPIAIFLLSWNEGRSVKTATSLKEGAANVVSVPADTIQSANDNKLVHISGEATTTATVRDPLFAASANAIRITRKVEMYQWKESEKSETHKKLGGGSETQKTYNYEKTWSDTLIRSSDFKDAAEHTNPISMIAKSASTIADKVTLGAFRLPSGVIGKMKGDVPLALSDADTQRLPANLRSHVKCASDSFYFGADPATPSIGDQRVTFTVLNPGTFSILARQAAGTLEPFPTKAGREIERVESGNVSAEAMFQHAQSENAMLTWVLRLVGTLLMAIGIGLILSPIATVADVIPFFGDLVGFGTSFAALILAIGGSFIVIAVAWFAVRPLLSAALIAASIGAVVFGRSIASKKKA